MKPFTKETPRILFVDDEQNVLAGLSRSLSDYSERWDIVYSASPEEAITAFKYRSFDVVISDMKMPKMNGIELVMTMRSISSKSVYIILTGHADVNMAIDAINRAQVFRFLTKPCPVDQLIETIDLALQVQDPRSASMEPGSGFADDPEDDEQPCGIDVSRPLFPGMWVLQIGQGIEGLYDTEEQLNNAPETRAARGAGRKIVVYGPDGLARG